MLVRKRSERKNCERLRFFYLYFPVSSLFRGSHRRQRVYLPSVVCAVCQCGVAGISSQLVKPKGIL